MTVFVVDASVVIKWVVDEPGSADALTLLTAHTLIAPDLVLPECANILWKKVRRRERSAEEALFASRLIEAADLQLRELLPLFGPSVELAAELDHPAYDCTYLALALQEQLQFVTADESLVRKLRQHDQARFRDLALPLTTVT